MEYFPFDEQTCVMKFGSWTYDGFQVRRRIGEKVVTFCSQSMRHFDLQNGTACLLVGLCVFAKLEWDAFSSFAWLDQVCPFSLLLYGQINK